jgi:ABC-type transporter lipoprotein component MlaA
VLGLDSVPGERGVWVVVGGPYGRVPLRGARDVRDAVAFVEEGCMLQRALAGKTYAAIRSVILAGS